MAYKELGPLRTWLSGIPLLGPIFACRREHFSATIKEFVVIILFATATFWLSAFFLKVLDPTDALPYTKLFQSTIKEGQLFIFATALLGPILVFAAEDPQDSRPFPARYWLMLLLVLLAIICSGGYALMRGAAAAPASQPLRLNEGFLADAALVCAGIAAAARFLAILYNKYRLSPEAVKAGEKKFSQMFAARHGQVEQEGGQ